MVELSRRQWCWSGKATNTFKLQGVLKDIDEDWGAASRSFPQPGKPSSLFRSNLQGFCVSGACLFDWLTWPSSPDNLRQSRCFDSRRKNC